MKNYVIITDSGSDISAIEQRRHDVISLPLSVKAEGENERADSDYEPREFYKKMRNGTTAKTAAVNYQAFFEKFRSIAERGYDVLYLGLSSAISGTYSAARAAAERLKKEMPERSFLTLDSKCASSGLGLLVFLTADKKREGASIYEAYEYASATAPKICHRFTVDDLTYLKRGGRISAASAFFGNALGIKPLFYVDNGGFLKASERVRGRMAAIEALAGSFHTLGGENHEEYIFISHADSRSDADTLNELLYKKYGRRAHKIFDIGAVIGAHAGPGTLALFFVGDSR